MTPLIDQITMTNLNIDKVTNPTTRRINNLSKNPATQITQANRSKLRVKKAMYHKVDLINQT